MTIPVRVPHPHVEVHGTQGAVVRGTRVPVRRLWKAHLEGITFEDLWERYPRVPRGHILDAISFAYDNNDLILEELREGLV